MTSTWARAAAKSAVWKIIGIVALVLVSMAAKIDPISIGKITVAYHVITLVLYVIHERVWNKIEWGRKEGERNGISNH